MNAMENYMLSHSLKSVLKLFWSPPPGGLKNYWPDYQINFLFSNIIASQMQ